MNLSIKKLSKSTTIADGLYRGKKLATKKVQIVILDQSDGNPKTYSGGAPENAWIGGMLNQPNSDEVANCRIVDFSTKLLAAASKYMPSYPYVINQP